MTKSNAKVSGGYQNYCWSKMMSKKHTKSSVTTVTTKTKTVNFKWDIRVVPMLLLALVFWKFDLDLFFSLLIAFIFAILFSIRKEEIDS